VVPTPPAAPTMAAVRGESIVVLSGVIPEKVEVDVEALLVAVGSTLLATPSFTPTHNVALAGASTLLAGRYRSPLVIT